jgi:hypothetical protein
MAREVTATITARTAKTTMQRPRVLAGGAEHVPESVDDEVPPQEERHRGEQQGRRPQVAPQASIEQARGDEASGQAGVVQAIHPGQPRSLLARPLVGGGIGVRAQRAGADEDRAGAGPGHAVQIEGHLARHAQRGEDAGQFVARVRLHDDQHLGVGPASEGGQGRGQFSMGPQCVGRTRFVGAAEGDELAADDDDARALPVGQLRRDVATGGFRAR